MGEKQTFSAALTLASKAGREPRALRNGKRSSTPLLLS